MNPCHEPDQFPAFRDLNQHSSPRRRAPSTPFRIGLIMALLAALGSCASTGGAYPPGRSDTITRTLDQWDDAKRDPMLPDFEKALESVPNPEPWLYVWLADQYRRKGDYARVERILNRVLEVDPAYAKAWMMRGQVRMWDLGLPPDQGPLDDLRKAADLAPLDVDPVLALVEQIRWQEGSLPEARQRLQRLLDAKPDQVRALALAAHMESEAGNRATALEYARQAWDALEREPDPYVKADFMDTLLALGQEAQAKDLYQRILGSERLDPWVLWKIGQIFFHHEEYGESLAAFQKGNELHGASNPDNLYVEVLVTTLAASGPDETWAARLMNLENWAGGRPPMGPVEKATVDLLLDLAGRTLRGNAPAREAVMVDALAQAVRQEWGEDLEVKRQYHPWLDDLLIWLGR